MADELQRWSPFHELDHFRRNLDDMFDRFLGGWAPMESMRGLMAPNIESFVEDGNFVVRADLPGIDPKDVEVSVNADMLTIRAKRETSTEEKKRHYSHREVSYGSYERTIKLPPGIDTSAIKANYKNGVLELKAPMPKELAARKVPITVEGK